MAETKERILHLIDEVAKTRDFDSARAAEELLKAVRTMKREHLQASVAGAVSVGVSNLNGSYPNAATTPTDAEKS